MTNRFSILDLHWDWRKQGRHRERHRLERECFTPPLHVERPKPEPKDPPGRKIEGRWVMRRDCYRWFIATYDRGVIWFYRSDVNAIRLRPKIVITIEPPPLFPERRWVEMFVDPEAREHPEEKDW